jgi:D-psicose/D-tagatose/L-ribulose 3-epimerase
MKVGMNLLLWTARPTPGEHSALVRKIKGWGFDGAELFVGGMTDADAKAFGRLGDDIALERTAIFSLDRSVADPASPDPALRREAIAQINHALDLARLMGSPILTGPLFQGLTRFTGRGPTTDEWRWAVDTVRQSAQHAAAMHLNIGLEPLNRFEMYLVNTIADGARFCRDVGLPNVGLLADTHHSNIEEYRPAEELLKHIKMILHVHISECNRGIPGQGHAATPEIFAALRQGGYDGWMVIEAFSTKVERTRARLHVWRECFEREDDVAERGLHYIRQCWDRAGSA